MLLCAYITSLLYGPYCLTFLQDTISNKVPVTNHGIAATLWKREMFLDILRSFKRIYYYNLFNVPTILKNLLLYMEISETNKFLRFISESISEPKSSFITSIL